jgi:hypothetical protein
LINEAAKAGQKEEQEQQTTQGRIHFAEMIQKPAFCPSFVDFPRRISIFKQSFRELIRGEGRHNVRLFVETVEI